ncbi:MAG: flagellar hook capping protein [Cellulosilyticum sp.]|nr:flagellar hook capping protein [Cellulosilyticum sp.]
MSSTNGVVPATSDYLSTKATESSKSNSDSMGKDQFMQLLVTQMKYQDPLNPMDNSEMLAQLAQFSALEQMLNVSQASQRQLASGLVGKYVEYAYKDTNTGVTSYQVGKVDSVTITGETPMINIGEVSVSIDDVYQVLDSSNIQSSESVFDVIGKTVQATIEEIATDGKEQSVIIEGKVENIAMKDGKPYVVIGTGTSKIETEYSNVQSIVENTSVTGREVTATVVNSEGKKESVKGTVEYIKITSSGTYVYVNGQFIDFDDIEVVH